MSETRQLGLVVGAGLALGIIALILVSILPPLFEGDLSVTSYEAVLSNDGALSEQYLYHVGSSGEYRYCSRNLLWTGTGGCRP